MTEATKIVIYKVTHEHKKSRSLFGGKCKNTALISKYTPWTKEKAKENEESSLCFETTKFKNKKYKLWGIGHWNKIYKGETFHCTLCGFEKMFKIDKIVEEE